MYQQRFPFVAASIRADRRHCLLSLRPHLGALDRQPPRLWLSRRVDAGMMPGQMDKAARCGEPSYIWRAGQERRLAMILQAAGERAGGCVLDDGCGVGAYSSSGWPSARGSRSGRAGPRTCRRSQPQGTFRCLRRRRSVALPGGLVRPGAIARGVGTRLRRPPGGRRGRPRAQAGRPHDRVRAQSRLPVRDYGIFWKGNYRFGNVPLVNYLPLALARSPGAARSRVLFAGSRPPVLRSPGPLRPTGDHLRRL